MKIDGGSKRKRQENDSKKKPVKKGSTAGHYERFVSNLLDEMDKFSEMLSFYIVMDNAPIHAPTVDEMIKRRGYRGIHFPKYSPELNPIEQFWAVLKNKVKRSQFSDVEDLRSRITEASQEISIQTIRNIISHSVNCFEKCLDKEVLLIHLFFFFVK
jgi:hypothetical protein